MKTETEKERKHRVSMISLATLKAELRMYQGAARLQTYDLSETLKKIAELEADIQAKVTHD